MNRLSWRFKIDIGSLVDFSDGEGNVVIFDRSANKIVYYGFCESFIDERTREQKIEDEDDNYLMENFGWNANSDHGHVIISPAGTEIRVPRTRALRRYNFNRVTEFDAGLISGVEQEIARELAAYQTAGTSVAAYQTAGASAG